jgi:uncharacterized protein YgiM (DUF1202 family)
MSSTFLKKTGQLMPRVLVTAVILVVVILASTVWAKKNPGLTAVVTVDYLPVRSTPHLVTATIAQLHSGQTVVLTGSRTSDNKWVQVRLLGVEGGWVPAESVRTRFPVANLAATTWADGRSIGGVAVVAAEYVPVRRGWGSTPGAAQPVVTRLTRGEQVELAGFRTTDGEWIQVVLPGNQIGWVDADSITSDYPFSALAPIEGAQ